MEQSTNEKRRDELLAKKFQFYGREEMTLNTLRDEISDEIINYYKKNNKTAKHIKTYFPIDEHAMNILFLLEQKHIIGYSISLDNRNYYSSILLSIAGMLLPTISFMGYDEAHKFSMDIGKENIVKNLKLLDKYFEEQEEEQCREFCKRCKCKNTEDHKPK